MVSANDDDKSEDAAKKRHDIDEFDGTAAWNAAADKDAWVTAFAFVDRPHPPHPFRFPPEAVGLIPFGPDPSEPCAQWEHPPLLLKQALAERRVKQTEQAVVALQARLPAKQRRRRQTGPVTAATCLAYAMFFAHRRRVGLEISDREFALLVAKFASERGLEGADLIDGKSAQMRELAGDILEALYPGRPR